MALTFAEVAIVVFLVWLWTTQIIVPVISGLPLFPLFHRRWRAVQQELDDVKEDEQFLKWRDEVAKHQKEKSHDSK